MGKGQDAKKIVKKAKNHTSYFCTGRECQINVL